MNQQMTIRGMLPGDSAIVLKVKATGELGRRIRDMGVAPGTRIQLIGRAPLRDPVEIKLRGYNLTLRNNEADFIFVRPVRESDE